ncbi:MAG: prolyl oligopeptidase family serine peptidase [Ignavibacteriaceae bacterium]
MSTSRIITRKKIALNNSQTKMVISGWGEESFNNSTVEKITYLSDGLKVKGFIAYPNNQTKKYPCVIWNRGGAGNRGAIDEFTARGIFGQLASWGYVVFASQYRGNAGGEGKDELGGSDVNDILNLIPLANEFDCADNSKWGIEGWSRGGMMTYITLTKQNKFKCAILVGAISNAGQNSDENSAMQKAYEGYFKSENIEEKLNERSAISFYKELPPVPYLIMHGGTDDIISPNQSLEMANKFREMDYQYRLVIFENGDHYLKTHRKEVDALRKLWYGKYLK